MSAGDRPPRAATAAAWGLAVALFLLALAPRLGLALALPTDDTVFVDRPYLEYARNFAEGRGFWASTPYPGIEMRTRAFRPPLFPFLWGCVYGLTGGAYAPVRSAHAVLGALAVLLAWAAGREMFPDRRGAAALAAVMAALYPALVWHSVHLMTEPLFIFFFTAAFWALLRSRREPGLRWAALVGAACGLAILSRSVLAGFVPVAGVWLWWARGRTRRSAAAALVLWAATALVIAPWVVRNAVVFRQFVPATTDAGHGFYVANNARAMDDPRGFWIPESWDFLRGPDGRAPDEVEASRLLMAEGWRFVRENPAAAARLMARRLWRFWRPWPHTDFVKPSHAAIEAVSFMPAVALAVPGFAAAWRRHRGRRAAHGLALLLVLYMTAIHAVFLAMTRYRAPLMPVLLLYAGYALAAAWDRLRGMPPVLTAGPAGFDRVAVAYDTSLPAHVQDHYLSRRTRLIAPLLGRGRGLDVGCGTGRLMAALAGDGRVFGVDASMGMLGVLRGEGRGSAARASTQALPFADGTFDATWCVAVLHHLSSPDAVAATIREMVRVTRPEGWVVVWDHNPLNPYWPVVMARVPQDAGTERLVPAKEIEAALAVAGASEWRVERRGLVPDFAPAWAMGLFRVVEALIECAPLLNRLAAHNVVVARVGDTGGRGNKTGAGA